MTEVDDVPIGHAAIDGQYWHIGAMTMRLPSSRAPTRNGVNSALILSVLPIHSAPRSEKIFSRRLRRTYPHHAGTAGQQNLGPASPPGYGARTICLHSDGKPASVSGGFGLRGGRMQRRLLESEVERVTAAVLHWPSDF
jgi:hypothetical protein